MASMAPASPSRALRIRLDTEEYSLYVFRGDSGSEMTGCGKVEGAKEKISSSEKIGCSRTEAATEGA